MSETDIDLGGGAADADDPFDSIPPGGFEPAKPGVAEGSLGGVNTGGDDGAEPPAEEQPEGDRATDVAPELPGVVGTFEPTEEERAAAEEGPDDPTAEEGVAAAVNEASEPLPDPDTGNEDTSSLSRITDDAEVDATLDAAEEAPEPPGAPQEPASAPEAPVEPPQEPAAPQEPREAPVPPADAAGGPGSRVERQQAGSTHDATRNTRRQGGTLSRDYMVLEKLDAGKLVSELCASELAPGIVNPIVEALTGVEVIVERTFENQGQQIDRIRARNGQNALRAAGNMLPLGFEGQMAALSEKALRFEPVKVGQREGRSIQVGSS